MTSFFGGDPSVSHFTLSVSCGSNKKLLAFRATNDWKNEASEKKRRDQVRKTRNAKLKALGFKEAYFQFKNKDEAGKKAAYAAAEAHARKWREKSGYAFEIVEGCFL